jgi:predicted RNase H-like HicB family nuclease/uncharacterized damage-inducible protein DinB
MFYQLAVEDIEPNHWLAWVLELPGCFSSASTEVEAVARAPEAIAAYFAWLSGHDPTLPAMLEPVEVKVVERFRAFPSSEEPDYLVNAFFEDDRRPLTYWEVAGVLRLLTWTRQELLQLVGAAEQEALANPLAALEGRSITDLLNHIAGAENWYFSRLGLGLPRPQLPEPPLERLELVRANTRTRLAALIGDEQITEKVGERWSTRKVLRRTLWHEQDHTRQIRQLLPEAVKGGKKG